MLVSAMQGIFPDSKSTTRSAPDPMKPTEVLNASREAAFRRLDRQANWYWFLSIGLLVLVGATVALQHLGQIAGADLPFIGRRSDQYPLLIGLVGLIVLFVLYISMKRAEIERLKADLVTQKVALSKIETRTNELENAIATLRALDEMKDTFLSTISHEFRTPLTAIQSYSEALMDTTDPPPAISKEFLGIINREARRLSLLVNDLQDLTRLEGGRADWKIEPHALRGLVEQAVATMSILANERGVVLVSEVPATIPDVEVDANRCVQVLTNLISNAVKFTSKGGTVTVSAVAEHGPRDPSGQRRGAVRISVADTGYGISKDELPRVFERFYRASNRTSSVEGTGLGLAISKEIVERSGGRLWAESVLGKGSTFHFTLPVPSAVLVE
jgi:signal transduction histidine kinase